MSPWKFNRFIQAIGQGAVFGYPTDTIWGFGCHPLIAESVARILEIKRRPSHKGLILLSSRLEYCAAYVDADVDQMRPIQEPTARPTTWLVPASEFCPDWLRGEFPTIAIRITDHPLLRLICDRIEAPVVSTSANRSGRAPVRNSLHMRKQFGNELDYVITGYTAGSGRPSEIKSLFSGEILRASA